MIETATYATRPNDRKYHAVAEHAVGLLLTLNRKIHRAYNRVRELNFSLSGLVGFDIGGDRIPRTLKSPKVESMKDTNRPQAVEKTATTVERQLAVEESLIAAAAAPRDENIRDLAHQKWRAAGCPEGDGVSFWLAAERELAAQTTQDAAQPAFGEYDDTVGF